MPCTKMEFVIKCNNYNGGVRQMFFCHKPILFVCNALELPYLLKEAPRHLFDFSRRKCGARSRAALI